MRLSLVLLVFGLCIIGDPVGVLAQAEARKGAPDNRERPSHGHGSPRLTRWELSAGTGITVGVLTGVPMAAPVLQTSVSYAIHPRFSLGVAYGVGEFRRAPYSDANGVVSQESTTASHYGARLKGIILRRRLLSIYGGAQLGVAIADQRYDHTFPTDFQVEDESAYLADRPSPFYDRGPQPGAVGFVGASVQVLPFLAVYAELGNNVALMSGGASLTF